MIGRGAPGGPRHGDGGPGRLALGYERNSFYLRATMSLCHPPDVGRSK